MATMDEARRAAKRLGSELQANASKIGRILEGDEICTCGHFHQEGTPHPDRGMPCGDYRCCIN